MSVKDRVVNLELQQPKRETPSATGQRNHPKKAWRYTSFSNREKTRFTLPIPKLGSPIIYETHNELHIIYQRLWMVIIPSYQAISHAGGTTGLASERPRLRKRSVAAISAWIVSPCTLQEKNIRE